jgi:L-alanine-DL-glutamate epimerase-like enolase superfamily enzyme
MDILRFINDRVGRITGAMKLAPGCMPSVTREPHNWGGALECELAFRCELAMPYNEFLDLMYSTGYTDRPWFKDRFRISAGVFLLSEPISYQQRSSRWHKEE